jgi:hypothetical protein
VGEALAALARRYGHKPVRCKDTPGFIVNHAGRGYVPESLRVLQEGTFLPVGGNALREVNVRVIAATHKDLGEMVKQGTFREDLYYRINVIRITVPPLRDRKDDLAVLIDHFFCKHRRDGQKARGLAPDALDRQGMGMHIMRYRAATIGAEFDARREERGGTVVSCSLSMERRNA